MSRRRRRAGTVVQSTTLPTHMYILPVISRRAMCMCICAISAVGLFTNWITSQNCCETAAINSRSHWFIVLVFHVCCLAPVIPAKRGCISRHWSIEHWTMRPLKYNVCMAVAVWQVWHARTCCVSQFNLQKERQSATKRQKKNFEWKIHWRKRLKHLPVARSLVLFVFPSFRLLRFATH